jgi:hypothetical protein
LLGKCDGETPYIMAARKIGIPSCNSIVTAFSKGKFAIKLSSLVVFE